MAKYIASGETSCVYECVEPIELRGYKHAVICKGSIWFAEKRGRGIVLSNEYDCEIVIRPDKLRKHFRTVSEDRWYGCYGKPNREQPYIEIARCINDG